MRSGPVSMATAARVRRAVAMAYGEPEAWAMATCSRARAEAVRALPPRRCARAAPQRQGSRSGGASGAMAPARL